MKTSDPFSHLYQYGQRRSEELSEKQSFSSPVIAPRQEQRDSYPPLRFGSELQLQIPAL